ncbi:MAG: DEAD/DEAH box helicase family protein [Isosphaeraceae bacterium]
MNPEDRARQDFDRQLGQCGWVVQDKGQMNISAALGVAVREFPMLTGEVDYLLYVSGKAIGVLEAKPKGHPLIGVETQASKYSGALPPAVPAYKSPLPFAYESTGTVTQFTNLLEPDARSREVFTFHRPEELLRLVSLDAQVRGKLKALPALDSSKLWSVQKRAIENLERSLAKNNPRSLIQMATGSGKTFTAVNACYRLIKFRRGEAGAVPRGPQQPRAADLPGVPAVREPRERLLEILIVMHLIPRVGGWTSGTDRSSPSSVGNSSDRQHSPYRPPPPEPVVCRNHSRSM